MTGPDLHVPTPEAAQPRASGPQPYAPCAGAPPSREWIKPDGSQGYFPLLEFSSRDVADRFQALVLPIAERALGLANATPADRTSARG